MYSMEMLEKGMAHISGGMEWNSSRFDYATQKSAQFKIYQLFVSGISH